MSIWIVTTGNSDIQLQHDRNWDLYNKVRDNLECDRFGSPTQIDSDNKEAGYTVPARVLGLTYGHQRDYYDDLKFPLLDTYREYFQAKKIKPEKIIVLLTDQSHIFNEEKIIYEKCPYWQDTCTLKPLFEWYFQEHFQCQPEFEYLTPTSGQGIDHWNETLSLVEETLYKLDCNPLKTVYVSHQAGTPAISSAVQFVSLGRFKKVKFLVSNQYFDDNYQQTSKSQDIESSNYWRGIQIQKAKQLIIGGFPGAALKVLEGIEKIDKTIITELEHLVNFFNLRSPSTDSSQDFEIPQATQRIVDTLDLISFFFNQHNYLQGITLLAAAQETFLKVAILSKLAIINETITLNSSAACVSQLVEWVPLGLFLSKSVANQSIAVKKNILQKLKFPIEKYRLESDDDFKVTNKNSALLAWLQKLEPNFPSWFLLKSYCDKNRNSDEDLRNQLLHNLRGMEDNDVIEYLLGTKNHHISNVMEAYSNHVKQPFLNSINYFNLPHKREKLNKKLQEIADSLV